MARKKNILISYYDYDYDGRLRALISIFSQIGELYSITRGSKPINSNCLICNDVYFKFILKAIKYGRKIGHADLLVIDNRKAIIPGFLLRWICKPSIIIQDCRELYLIQDVKHLKGKIGCIFEKYSIKNTDIIISANIERAQIMKDAYCLEELPLVFENVRQLQYTSEEEKQAAETRLKDLIIDGEVRILSSSGCNISRMNDVLVKNISKVQHRCRLFLVGNCIDNEKKILEEIVKKNNLSNVELIGLLNQNELKYLIDNSHIGIVNYNQKDTNNKYCASGKLYEFIYERIPVVCTTNPPLFNLCKKEGFGISDDDYYLAINEIISHYDLYKEKAIAFSSAHKIEDYEHSFIELLKEKIRG